MLVKREPLGLLKKILGGFLERLKNFRRPDDTASVDQDSDKEDSTDSDSSDDTSVMSEEEVEDLAPKASSDDTSKGSEEEVEDLAPDVSTTVGTFEDASPPPSSSQVDPIPASSPIITPRLALEAARPDIQSQQHDEKRSAATVGRAPVTQTPAQGNMIQKSDNGHGSSLSNAEIVGISVGVILAVIFAAFALWFMKRRHTRKSARSSSVFSLRHSSQILPVAMTAPEIKESSNTVGARPLISSEKARNEGSGRMTDLSLICAEIAIDRASHSTFSSDTIVAFNRN
ncbi:MAG: hypothetical protein SGCHY_003520 [Lobulomycetales sp.]